MVREPDVAGSAGLADHDEICDGQNWTGMLSYLTA